MRLPKLRPCALAVSVVLLHLLSSPASAQPQTLYGYCGVGVGVSWHLITINPTTGAGSLVALTPYRSPGLAFRGGKLYIFDNTSLKMMELDRATGAAINSIDIGPVPFNNEGDITFRSDGIGFMTSWPAGSPLRRFDLSTGTSTVTGPLSRAYDGLAFNAAGVLYALAEGGAQLYTMDPTTTATTLVGNTGIPGANLFNGALAFDASGTLYAALAPWPATSSSYLYRIDPATGAAILIGDIGFGSIVGLAFGPPLPPPPPPLPPTPPPPPKGDEGTYRHCAGPSGAEGTFGFGGGQRIGATTALHSPLLTHPQVRGEEVMVVSNAAYRQAADAASSEPTFLDWFILVGCVLVAGTLVLTWGLISWRVSPSKS